MSSNTFFCLILVPIFCEDFLVSDSVSTITSDRVLFSCAQFIIIILLQETLHIEFVTAIMKQFLMFFSNLEFFID